MPTINLNGDNLVYSVFGSPNAPLLILIHGWFSHRGVWNETIATFKDYYYCVAIDLLGFGDSEKPIDGDYGINAQGERVLALAEKLGFDSFSLIGHSMGGQIAFCIASILAPEKVEKLVSVSGVVTGKLSPIVERIIYPMMAFSAKFPRTFPLWRWLNHSRRYAYFHF